MRYVGHLALMGEMRNIYKILVGISEIKRPRHRPGRRCEDNSKMDLNELGFEDVDWNELYQNCVKRRVLVNMAMHFEFHKEWGIT
jgi:hypothetical protein